jgi:subtilisin family serine protease
MPERIIRKSFVTCLLLTSCVISAFCQYRSADSLDQKYLNWHNQDPSKDASLGTSVDRVYAELIPGKPAKKTVVVAVIDSGIDINHEDLQGRIWVNEDEIPGNGIDDDQNGYVDDINGWNFIGNKNGENILYETMECTRVYKLGSGPHFNRAKDIYEKEVQKRLTEKQNIKKFEENYYKAKSIIKDQTGITVNSLKDLDAVSPDHSEKVMAAKRFLSSRYENGFEEKMLIGLKENNADYLEKFLNKDFDPRAIVGDDPNDINSLGYGNADVKGPRSNHGTSVAGVIAAVRNNGVGINGIASDVRIMCIRSTPRGDERDKDVALAIKYAVENGADVINLSFGKPISPQKQFVDDAVKLAEQKDVLIVHGSGNSGENIDEQESYPSDRYLDGTEATNWINVGASGSLNNDAVAAVFSNYGQKHVDLFAPGENIISTDSSSTYSMNDGTSLSAPVVSGIAALILSHYPDLTSRQLISLLLESAYKIDRRVVSPGLSDEEPRKVKFSSLSKSGGIVNAFEAMKKAGTSK